MDALITTPLAFTLDNDVASVDDNDDGKVYSGAEHLGIIPRATSISCTITRFAGARLFFHQAILLYIPCLAHVAPKHSNATATDVL